MNRKEVTDHAKKIQHAPPKPEHEKVQAYATAYFAYVIYGWIDIWFQRGMRESADEIAEMFRAQGF